MFSKTKKFLKIILFNLNLNLGDWGLTSCNDFYYVNQSGCTTIDNVDDKKEFNDVMVN